MEHVGRGVSRNVGALVARCAGVAEVGVQHGAGAAPASRRRVSQSADEHVVMYDGFEHGTECGIDRRYGEAKCVERGDRRVGDGAPQSNCNDHERVEGPCVWVTCAWDKASYRGAWIAQVPRIILGVLTPDGRTKVGVVSDGELDDGDNDAPVMVEAVQARAEWAGSAAAVVVHRGSAVTTIPITVTIIVGRSEHFQRALPDPRGSGQQTSGGGLEVRKYCGDGVIMPRRRR